MIKFVVAALWISIATTGAMLFSFQWSQEPEVSAEEAAATAFNGIDYVKTPVISVPVFDKGKVYGYFLSRLVFTAEATRLAELKLPPDVLLSDAVYTYLFANPQIDFTKRDSLDFDVFREELRTAVNTRIGEELIREVLIEQVDFLPKQDVQSTSIKNTSSARGPSGTLPGEKEADTGH
jgi:hypothetical protein